MSETVRFLGTTDDVTSCDCCGRKDLKSTVAIDLDGDTVYYGVVCAARKLGRKPKDIRADAHAADRAAWEAKQAAERAAHAVRDAAWQMFLDAACPEHARSFMGGPDRCRQLQALGGYTAARAAYLAAGGE